MTTLHDMHAFLTSEHEVCRRMVAMFPDCYRAKHLPIYAALLRLVGACIDDEVIAQRLKAIAAERAKEAAAAARAAVAPADVPAETTEAS